MSNEKRNGFIFIWRIENVSSCYQKHGEYLESPEFAVDCLGGSRWFVRLFPRGVEDEESVSCSLYRKENDSHNKWILIDCTIEIIVGDDLILDSGGIKNGAFGQGGWNLVTFRKIDKLLNTMNGFKEDTLSVRCHGMNESMKKLPAEVYVAKTTIGIDRCSFVWNVKYPGSAGWSDSKKFSFPKAMIKVTLTAPEDAVLVNICKTADNPTLSRFVICEISLANADGMERKLQRSAHLFESSNDSETWTFPSFFGKTLLNTSEENFLKNGTFVLIFTFSVSNGIDSETINSGTKYRNLLEHSFINEDTFSSLRDNLRDMFTSKKHVDVKLRVANEIFPSHKSILAARSPVFSAMFERDMLEKRSGIVDISDVDAETLRIFLGFLYTGMVGDLDYERASKLLLVADKYQVQSLKEKCCAFLMSILPKNVCEILVISDMLGHERLKSSAVDHIRTNVDMILSSREWSQLVDKNVRLVAEVVRKLSMDLKNHN